MNTELYLLRHGEPEIRNTLLGVTDSELTSLGWRQLCTAAESLKAMTKLITSPLVRCSKFAEYWASKMGLPIEINHAFQEYDFGQWDGQSLEDIQIKHSVDLSLFLNDPASFPPKDGETLTDFQKRVRTALDHLLNENAGNRLLLITHAGVIRCLISWCLKIDPLSPIPFQNIAIDYGSITHISIYHGEALFPQLKSMNITRNDE